ncbi:hypothetical protein [Allopontixanthobacter sediminis]|uniref:SURF1-like protein n=1 Tax=Allopontixanthobacter sediminis TaxID=1689985 RepID=A0A845B342_9SPHN|nr:hypothetical protein [Allopontixanthobacter sediminis]MXP44606.1 hypothetical protein [Allopontixanthobacter sediminis]
MSFIPLSVVRLAARAWIVLCALYFLWEAVSYRGFFGRLAELQLGYFGAYAPLLTFLFLFCLAALPAWLVLRVLRKRENAEQSIEQNRLNPIKRAKTLRAVLYGFGMAACLVIAGFVIFTLFMLPGTTGARQTIAASDFGVVSVEEGPARIVGGEVGEIIFFGQDWFLGDDRMAFAPYRAAGQGKSARVFVQLDATDRNELIGLTQKPAWSGLLVEGGLPGTARALFNSIGVGIGDPYYTLYIDKNSLEIRYWLQAIQWAILAAFLLIFGKVQSRRIRRMEAELSA